MSRHYRVDGMTCQGCANAVSKAIKAAQPDAEVTVDLAAKTVAVSQAAPVDVVAKAVEDAGFTFVGVGET